MIPVRLTEKPRKYRNVPNVVDGIRFASGREALRYSQLKQLEKAGVIEGLRLQRRYQLMVNDYHVCTYIADFWYIDKQTGQEVIEDAKGIKTREFITKAKLFYAIHGKKISLI